MPVSGFLFVKGCGRARRQVMNTVRARTFAVCRVQKKMTNHEHADAEHSAISGRERDLVVFEMTEMAKTKLIKWLRSAAAVVAIVLALLGLKAYTHYRSALAKSTRKSLNACVKRSLNTVNSQIK
jgi:hypothetical protein